MKNFEEIYNATYEYTLKYILCKCSNIDDVNDLVQDTYVELYNILSRKDLTLENYSNYIIGIAKKKLQRHYGLLYQIKIESISKSADEEYELEIPSDMDIEADTITKLDAENVWKYIKKKNIKVVRVFYLYYYLELTISQIAKKLNMSESNVKNVLYRTIKDIKENVKIEGDINV